MMLTLHWLWHDFQSLPHQSPGRMRPVPLPERSLLQLSHPQWLRGVRACRGRGSSPLHPWREGGVALPDGAGSDGWRSLRQPGSLAEAGPGAPAAAGGRWCTTRCSRRRSHDAGSSPSGCGAPWWVQWAYQNRHWPGPGPALHPCTQREEMKYFDHCMSSEVICMLQAVWTIICSHWWFLNGNPTNVILLQSMIFPKP